jgi:chemotaxis protein methyltransferase CheR
MSWWAEDDLGITDREFALFRDLVYAKTGISLGPHKRPLLRSRLGKRLRALGLDTLTQYYDHLVRPGADDELGRFVNAMTTNKTDFFREAHHFRYLTEEWAPRMRAELPPGAPRQGRVWSAGCSSGEEPYSLAVTLLDALPGWDVRVLGSDIDTDVLEHARAGIYRIEQVSPVPPLLLRRYFLKGRGAQAGLVRVVPEVAEVVVFRRINFLDHPWPIKTRFDAVFCRNVLIYFDRPTQERVLTRLLATLKPGGLLFLGHSEIAYGLLEGVTHLGNTIYIKGRRPEAGVAGVASPR